MLGSLMSFFKSEEAVPEMDTHWISESGIIDAFVVLGPKPHDVFKQYAILTGTTQLPPVSWTRVFSRQVDKCSKDCLLKSLSSSYAPEIILIGLD